MTIVLLPRNGGYNSHDRPSLRSLRKVLHLGTRCWTYSRPRTFLSGAFWMGSAVVTHMRSPSTRQTSPVVPRQSGTAAQPPLPTPRCMCAPIPHIAGLSIRCNLSWAQTSAWPAITRAESSPRMERGTRLHATIAHTTWALLVANRRRLCPHCRLGLVPPPQGSFRRLAPTTNPWAWRGCCERPC